MGLQKFRASFLILTINNIFQLGFISMKTLHYFSIALCLLILTTTSCTKYEEVKESELPVITYTSITPKMVKQFEENVVITINYKDGNGDLGHENPDDLSIYVKDNRLKKEDYYHLHLLSPPSKSIAIQGALDIHLKNTFLIGSGNSESTTYEIKIKDRAGNWSNSITTEPITINK